MFFLKDQLIQKVQTSLSKQYLGAGVQTKINRIRKTTPTFETDLEALLKNHKLHRKCILSCSFLSKGDLAKEFNQLKKGGKVKGHIIQLIWILSSFSHAAKEANVIPMIYCAA